MKKMKKFKLVSLLGFISIPTAISFCTSCSSDPTEFVASLDASRTVFRSDKDAKSAQCVITANTKNDGKSVKWSVSIKDSSFMENGKDLSYYIDWKTNGNVMTITKKNDYNKKPDSSSQGSYSPVSSYLTIIVSAKSESNTIQQNIYMANEYIIDNWKCSDEFMVYENETPLICPVNKLYMDYISWNNQEEQKYTNKILPNYSTYKSTYTVCWNQYIKPDASNDNLPDMMLVPYDNDDLSIEGAAVFLTDQPFYSIVPSDENKCASATLIKDTKIKKYRSVDLTFVNTNNYFDNTIRTLYFSLYFAGFTGSIGSGEEKQEISGYLTNGILYMCKNIPIQII